MRWAVKIIYEDGRQESRGFFHRQKDAEDRLRELRVSFPDYRFTLKRIR